MGTLKRLSLLLLVCIECVFVREIIHHNPLNFFTRFIAGSTGLFLTEDSANPFQHYLVLLVNGKIIYYYIILCVWKQGAVKDFM